MQEELPPTAYGEALEMQLSAMKILGRSIREMPPSKYTRHFYEDRELISMAQPYYWNRKTKEPVLPIHQLDVANLD